MRPPDSLYNNCMFMAIDIGNSSIAVGCFTTELRVHKIETRPARDPREYAGALKEVSGGETVEGVAICSVVPECTWAVRLAVHEAFGLEPLVVDHESPHGLRLAVERPEEVGADRLAGAAAGAAIFGGPIAVVDFGTATTVNFVSFGNVFEGGSILPGLELMAGSLAGETAKLPRVELGADAHVPGRDTWEAIVSGIIYGTAGAVERIISGAEAREDSGYRVCVTGGSMDLVIPHLRKVDFKEPNLTLKGLRVIFGRFRRGA